MSSKDVEGIVEKLQVSYTKAGLAVVETNFERPWGGYVRFDNACAKPFIERYMPKYIDITGGNISPKFLFLREGASLSKHRHFRRSEFWRAHLGSASVEVEDRQLILNQGQYVEIDEQEIHRSLGLSGGAVIAEIWFHTRPGSPSDEEDIVGLEDFKTA